MLLSLLKGKVELNYLKIIHNSSLHLQNVIEDALDLSRIENKQFEMV